MGKYPYFPFYPADWIKDPDLRRCDHGAKGVWIDMLCLMHQCQDPGVLATNNIPWTKREIANAIGGKYQTVAAHIDELISKGVCSIGPNGAIYSRRMVTDAKNRDREAQRKRDVRDLSGDCPGDVRDLSGSSPPLRAAASSSEPEPESEKENRTERVLNVPKRSVRSSLRSRSGGEDGGAVADSPRREQALDYALEIGLAEWKALDWWHKLEADNWLIQGKPVRDWRKLMKRQRDLWRRDGSPPKGPLPAAVKTAQALTAKPNKYLNQKPLTAEEIQAGIEAAKKMREALK